MGHMPKKAAPDQLTEHEQAHPLMQMDIHPWPTGTGLQGGAAWWEHVRNLPEHQRLKMLMIVALLSSGACRDLLCRDEALFERFNLPLEMRDWLRELPAITFAEITHAVHERLSETDNSTVVTSK